MSLVAPIVDGVLQTSSTSSESLSKANNNPTEVDSDMFLTLLVAEMQNQDPLEPTSNTEWVSQYATFTQVEQMNEVTASMDLVRANGLVGQEVIVKVTSQSTGETSYKRGNVDYVLVENGEPLLVIDENKYSIDDLDTIASSQYFGAYDKYSEFATKMASLPDSTVLTKSHQGLVKSVYDLYSGMSDYEKEYTEKFAAEEVIKYKACVEKMKNLGISLEEEVVPETTLDDVIENFTAKMDELMAQIGTLNERVDEIATVQSSNVNTSTEEKSDTSKEESDEVSDEVLDQLTEDVQIA